MAAIKQTSVKTLVPYANNARTHSVAQIDKIAASIQEFGFVNPIIVDGKNGIIAGHGRLLAAQKLGLAKVPCMAVSHLTKAQKKAYILLDNRLALDSGWDDTMLRIEFEDLKKMNFNMELTGFGENEMAAFLFTPESGAMDPAAEWAKSGMPSYDNEDQKAPFKLQINFYSEADKLAFGKLIGQDITLKTKSVYYPEVAREKMMDKEYGC